MSEEKIEKSIRPPIVAILGHVDHGKTTLLDYIRKSNTALKEAGGITQKIGAYQIDFEGKKITFIDTPGHQAFSKMRSRGVRVADLVVLVVAADDGVMPQTIESLKYIKEANTPFLVAINKIDLPGVNLERVKKQLIDNGIEIEEAGGKIVTVPVSAKTGEGVKDLLEMILLLAEMEGLKGSPQGDFEAVIIESKMTKAGPTGTLIVKDGVLRIGEQILTEGILTKVRGMKDENGKSLVEVLPGQPAEVIGFKTIPPVGARVEKARGEEPEGKISPEITGKIEVPKEEKDKLKIILKADSFGSLEAIRESLPEKVFLVFFDVGDISESDVFTAQAASAQIVGFNVRVSPGAEKLSEREKIKIKTFKIIYELLEFLEKEAGEIAIVSEREILGKAAILRKFEIEEVKVAGCRVLEGKININYPVIIQRNEKDVGEGKISSMKHQKTEISEASQGEEFGAVFSPSLDFRVGDMLISFRPAQNQ